MAQPDICPCCSGHLYQDCCGRLHQGAPAQGPEALMRSRYSAFVRGLSEYLIKTWHPETRPPELILDNSPRWSSLQILSADQRATEGKVHFRAMYQTGSGWGCLEERSEFIKQGEQWY